MTVSLSAALRDLLTSAEPVAEAVVAAARGSTPREGGARMLVTPGAVFGTIGGGRLEWAAMERARALLAAEESEAMLDMPLGPAVGQCCGGHVRIAIRRADHATLAAIEAGERAEAASRPAILLFGAGHVGQALAAALAPLPFRLRWIDPRASQFPATVPDGVEAVVAERLVDEVAAAPRRAGYLVLTHSHALDFEICAAVLERGDFAYLGLIGSATKRARFERGLRELGIARERLVRLVCPIGGSRVRDKRPAVIAALVAAELVTTFAERLAASAPPPLVTAG
jgi:xanthine dehydrogenase accessory factor